MPQFVAIGECMVELSEAEGGLLRRGFAGDTFNTAYYARKLLPAAWTVSYLSALGDDALSTQMLAFMTESGIDASPVRRIAGKSPGLYMISLLNGERSFIRRIEMVYRARPSFEGRAVVRVFGELGRRPGGPPGLISGPGPGRDWTELGCQQVSLFGKDRDVVRVGRREQVIVDPEEQHAFVMLGHERHLCESELSGLQLD